MQQPVCDDGLWTKTKINILYYFTRYLLSICTCLLEVLLWFIDLVSVNTETTVESAVHEQQPTTMQPLWSPAQRASVGTDTLHACYSEHATCKHARALPQQRLERRGLLQHCIFRLRFQRPTLLFECNVGGSQGTRVPSGMVESTFREEAFKLKT